MADIQRFIRKKVKVDDAFSRGFLYYCLKSDGNDFTITKIKEVVDQIKKDFPNTTDEQVAIKSFTPEEGLVLYFYCFEIPNDMHFEEFKYKK